MNASRRDYLKTLTAAAMACKPACASTPATTPPPGHDRRIQWWREAKFGMFIHWGLFSILARDCWANGNIEAFTRKGNTLYVHVHFWPGETVTVGGVKTKVKSAKLLSTGQPVAFTQKGRQLIFSNLPARAPDDLVTVIVANCDSEPVQDALSSRVDT